MEKKKETKRGRVPKALSVVVAVCMLMGLIVVATATEKNEIYASYDKNNVSEEYKEVVLPVAKGKEGNEEHLKGIRTYVYNEEGARLEEDGEMITVELSEGKDYIIREVAEADEALSYEIVLLVKYLNTLYEGEYTFLLDFIELQEEETEEAIIKTEEYTVEIKNSALVEEVEEEGAEDTAEEIEANSIEATSLQTTSMIELFQASGDAYDIVILSTTMEENAATFRFSVAEGTGTLRTSINLQGSGEKDRYIIIRLPAYGMQLSSTLPTTESGITAVTRVDNTTLRLDIIDTATQVLNIDIPYVRAYMPSVMEQAWRNGTPPSHTGFNVEVYGKKGSETVELLNEEKYGNWFVDLSGTLDIGAINNTTLAAQEYIGVVTGVTYWGRMGALLASSGIGWSHRTTAIDHDVSVQPQYVKMIKWYIPQEIYDASDVNQVIYPLKEDGKGKYIELLPTTSQSLQSVLCGNQANMLWNNSIMRLVAAGIREHLVANATYPIKLEVVYGIYTETGIVDKYVMHDIGELRTSKDTEIDAWRVGANYSVNVINGSKSYNDRGLTMFRRGYDKSNHYKVLKGKTDNLYLSDYGNVAYLTGDTSYNPKDRYEGLTVTYDFPYELQPTAFQMGFSSYQSYLGYIDELICEIAVSYADGTTRIIGAGGPYAPEINLMPKQGTYIKSVTVTWDEFWQNYGYSINGSENMTQLVDTIKPYIKVQIMDKDKDGNNIPSGTMVHVDVTLTKGDGTVIAKATEEQLCFFLYDEPMGCPALTQMQASGYESAQWQVRAYDQKQEIGYIARTTLATGYSIMRDTIRDPKLVIGMGIPTANASHFYPVVVNNLERVGYFMTGKMRVYPMLAGWTVNYATYDGLGVITQRTMTLPIVIPAEGYELQLIIPVGERLASNTYVNATHYEGIVISKEGYVSGWTTNINLVSHIELQSPRQKDDGSSFESVGNEGRTYSMGKLFVALTNTDCNCPVHTAAGLNHNHPSLADALAVDKGYGANITRTGFGSASGIFDYDYLMGFQSRFTMASGTSFTPTAPGYEIYQNESMTVSVGGFKHIVGSERGTSSSHIAPFFKTQKQLYDIINWEKTFRPTMYIKVVNNDFMIAEGQTMINVRIAGTGSNASSITPSNYLVPAELEMIVDENWERWVRIRALDEVVFPIGYGWSQANINITSEIEVYAIPGAAVGVGRPFIEKWYLEDELGKWEEIYDGSEEKYYANFTVNNRVADVLDLTEEGDRTTPKLYEYVGYPINVYTKVFSGVSIYPGVRNSYAIANRHQNFYPDARNELVTLVTITTDNSNLEDYEAIFELPRKGQSISGSFYSTLDGIQTVTSEVDIFLRGAVTERSNSSGAIMEISYRIGTQWYSETEVVGNGGWESVSAYRITTDELTAQSSVNFNVPLTAKEKTTLDDLDAYMGGVINYEIVGMPTSVNMIFGQYTYKSYVLEGMVWNDVNEDGAKVVTDEVLSGYKVDLKRTSNNSVIATYTTGEDGVYTMVTNEFTDMYLEITIPSGKKLTYQRTSLSPSAYADDSDFDRITNRHEIASLTGSITVDAGVITLPIVTMPDYIVPQGDTLNITGTRTGGYTLTISYAPADSTIATIADTTGTLSTSLPTGSVTGLQLGETIVTMTVANSLGDTATTTFKVTVIQKEVAFDLTKQLDTVAQEVGVFVFRIEKMSDTNQVEQSFYQTIKVPAGAANATIRIEKLMPGNYRVTEVESNWRYSVVGMIGQTITVTNPDVIETVTFINKLDNTSWSSGKTDLTNTMKRVQ